VSGLRLGGRRQEGVRVSIITAHGVEAALLGQAMLVPSSGLARASRFRYTAGIGPGLPIPILRLTLRSTSNLTRPGGR